MKKYIALLMALLMVLTLCGCGFKNYDFMDTNYSFDKAVIKLPDGDAITVDIKKWADSQDGEQLTITDTDGKIYLVNSVNCVLIKEGK